MRAGIGFVGALACLGSGAFAGIINPIEYRMLNGEGQLVGGWFNYWDETYNGSGNPLVDLSPLTGGLGQLTDGVIGHTDWWGNLGNGPAFEWVAWTTINPTIIFRFDQPYIFDQVSLHVNNSDLGAVTIHSLVTFDFSLDGINFTSPNSYVTDPGQYGSYGGRWVDYPLTGVGSYVRANLIRTGPNWIFLSEVEFRGRPIPTPGSTVLVGAGLMCVGRHRRRG